MRLGASERMLDPPPKPDLHKIKVLELQRPIAKLLSDQKGVQASRSEIHYFRHNDMKHFKELLDEQAAKDKKVS